MIKMVLETHSDKFSSRGSGGTPENQELSLCIDNPPQVADGFNTGENLFNGKTSPTNKNDALVIPASSVNGSGLNLTSSYDDISSDSISNDDISSDSISSSPPLLHVAEAYPLASLSRSPSLQSISEPEDDDFIVVDSDNDASASISPQRTNSTSHDVDNKQTESECKDDDEVEILPTPIKPPPEVVTIDSDNEMASANSPQRTENDWSHITKRRLKKSDLAYFSAWVQDSARNLLVYKCPKCCAFYERRIWFERHMLRHDKKQRSKCGMCKWYLDFNLLQTHRLYAHDLNNRNGMIYTRGPSQSLELLVDFKQFGGTF